MRWQAVIILAVMIVSIVAPASLPSLADRAGESEIGTLNVCHSATPSLASSGQMPCVNTCPGRLVPSPSIEYGFHTDIVLAELLFPKRYEHPPKA